MHVLTATLLAALSALALAVPATPTPNADGGHANNAAIPTECALLRGVYMGCAAGGVRQCHYIDDADKPAVTDVPGVCDPSVPVQTASP